MRQVARGIVERQREIQPANSTSITAELAREISEQLVQAGVPLILIVPFLLRCRGYSIAQVATIAAVHRSHLYACLEGKWKAPTVIRWALEATLGFDPWQKVGLAEG